MVAARPDVEIVACCEDDPPMRERLAREGKVRITHTDHRAMLAEVDLDVAAVGEDALLRLWQEKRGEIEPDDLSCNLIVQLA